MTAKMKYCAGKWLQFKAFSLKGLPRSKSRVRTPSPDLVYKKHKSDTSTLQSRQKADSSYGSITPIQSANDKLQTLSEHKDDTSPVDFTALLRHRLGADFAGLATAWPKIPEHIRAAIMALLATVKP